MNAPVDHPRVLQRNAGWCWFQDERAIVHDGRLSFGSVSSPGGDVNVTTVDLTTGESKTLTLHDKLQSDDHDAPALYVRKDGQLLAMYTRHSNDRLIRWRIGAGAERTREVNSSHGVCYSNVYRLSAEDGRLYNFFRGDAYNPHYLISDNDGTTWRYGGRLLHSQGPLTDGKRTARRPYLRYASNGIDTIHFIATEGHPRDVNNSIYHGFISGGKVHRSDGTAVGELSNTGDTTVEPTDLTRIFEGGPNRVAWTTGIRVDPAGGHLYAAFSVRMDDGGQDLRYHHARWDGRAWTARPLAPAGQRLYPAETDYSGLVALHPYDPDTLYISTNADPVTGQPLISSADGRRHFEIFRGTADASNHGWTWNLITSNSSADNLRPIVAPGDPNRAPLIWLRGTYRTYESYDLEAVGAV